MATHTDYVKDCIERDNNLRLSAIKAALEAAIREVDLYDHHIARCLRNNVDPNTVLKEMDNA